jgi:hypothetical protein
MPAEIAERARSREALQAEVPVGVFPPSPHTRPSYFADCAAIPPKSQPNGNVEMSTMIE